MENAMELTSLIFLPLVGILAGLLGALLGIGGGIVIVSTLVLAFGVSVKVAIAASLVAVIASSTSSGSVYVGKGLANMKLGMLLEVATTIGGVLGAVIALKLPEQMILILFSMIMLLVSLSMVKKKSQETNVETIETPDDIKKESARGGVYFEPLLNKYISYKVKNIGIGSFISAGAGMLSGLLGVGGGFIKVPAMNLIMGLPIKVAVGTSNFMIGVTAISSFFIYFIGGHVRPMIAAPITIGVVVGSFLGTRIFTKASPKIIKIIFASVAMIVAVQMFLKGMQV